MCYFPVRYNILNGCMMWWVGLCAFFLIQCSDFCYLDTCSPGTSGWVGFGVVVLVLLWFVSFCTSDHCFGLLFFVIATLLCTFTCWVWCCVLCHTVGSSLVVATLCSFYFWDFPWYYSRRENTAQMGFCWRKIIISLFLLFWLNHLVRFTHFHKNSVLQIPIHFSPRS